jgi:hypothetical protein
MPTPAAPLAPFLSALILAGRDWMSKQPPWVHVVAVVLSMILGGLTHKTCTHAPTPVNVTLTAPVTVAAPEPAPVMIGAPPVVEQLQPGHRIVAESMRKRVAAQLQKDGYKLVGGNAAPWTAEDAERHAAKLTDLQIVEGGKTVGAFHQTGDGPRPFLDFIRSIFAWIREHPEEVLAWLEILLSLLMFP